MSKLHLDPIEQTQHQHPVLNSLGSTALSHTVCWRHFDRRRLKWILNEREGDALESQLLPFVIVVDDPVGDHLQGFHRDGRDVLQLQLLHGVAAGT